MAIKHVSLKLLFCLSLLSISVQAVDHSRYFDKYNSISYPAITTPTNPVKLRWDYSAGKKLDYRIDEKTFGINKTRITDTPSVSIQTFELNRSGSLLFASLFDNTARMTLTATNQLSETRADGSQHDSQTTNSRYVIDAISSTGRFRPVTRQDYRFQGWLALPRLTLSPGMETAINVSQIIRLPATTDEITLTGDVIVKLEGFVKCGDNRCAELRSTMQIQSQVTPENLKGSFSLEHATTTRTWFDIDENRLFEFVALERIEMDMDVESDEPGHTKNSHLINNQDSFIHIKFQDVRRSETKKLTIKKYKRGEQKTRN